ncbi:MAG: hypothetical protein ACK41D_05265 [Rubricoccaceae bacterium]
MPTDPRQTPVAPETPAGLEGASGPAADRPLPPEALPFVPTETPDNAAPPDLTGTDVEGVLLGADAVRRRHVRLQAMRVPLVAAGSMMLLALVAIFVARPSLIAFAQDGFTASTALPEDDPLPIVAFNPTDPFSFSSLDIHPDRLHSDYFAGAFLLDADRTGLDSLRAAHLADFRWRLDMYRDTYGQDSNFSIRVYDERDGRTLEVFTLHELEARHNALGASNWDEVDRARRAATTALRQKWEAAGIPRDRIVVRWGRANQTLEARERERPFVEYEIQLARQLGLSLLATEIGTVETFNQDHLVSSAGARSRYQMMPDIMRLFNVETYRLPSASGGTVEVREERHPLLTLEPSMMLVRAYSNAVGHELPGVSAYHTGPGNIFRLYREYLRAHPTAARRQQHVSDAYMWGVTEGFERVRAGSSFGPESRAYVLKAYGALRATEHLPVDPAETDRVERVRLRAGESVTLARLLEALEPHEGRLAWGRTASMPNLYDRFAALNPHILLPAAGPGGGIPAAGNVRLMASVDNKPVRFFLPAGADEVLRRVGLDVLGTVFPFNEQTYRVEASEVTAADRDYAALVRDIGQFGFSHASKRRLDVLFERMQDLARQQPESRYRQAQARIIRIHRSVWSTAAFNDLAATTATLLSLSPQALAEQDSVAYAPPPLTGTAAPRPPVTLPTY